MRKGSQLHKGVALKYDVEQRSKSLVRGAHQGGRSGPMSGRQKAFEEHVERFNQLDPLLKGQTTHSTIDYGQQYQMATLTDREAKPP